MTNASPQVLKFEKEIRDRKSNYDNLEQVAAAVRENLESWGMSFTEQMISDLDEAVQRVRATEQDVVILRKNSIIADREKWYDGPRGNDRHWPALHAYLLNTKGWAEETIRSLDEASNEVVSLLDNPAKDQFRCRGLVVGYVQSGKTANMTAVIAKAVDAGYNLIIVLGGVTNKLRKQTQDRFAKDVVGRHRHLWELYTTSDENGDFSHPANGAFTMPHEGHAQLIVMKKEVSRLRALRKTIRKTPKIVMDKLKVLLIDDECDQASVNSSRGDFDMTRINEAIRQVLAELPAVSYVGYTATPFANVFIDPFPFNQEDLDDLYPADFITALEKPIGYFGAAEVFGSDSAEEEDDGRDMVRLLAKEDPDLIRPTRNDEKESFRPIMTASLENAIMWFLASCAIRRSRGHQDKHMSMLVHSSQYVAQHDYMSDLIRNWIETHGPDIVSGSGETGARFDALFLDEVERTAPPGADRIPESLETVRDYLPDVLAALTFPVENGKSDRRLDYENGPVTCIVVGGTVLARGLTLEGLTVSYFLRTSKQYDTLLQMGRWFGYRPGYDDLPRLWTTADLIANFRALARIEEEIRDDIAEYNTRNLTPMQFAVKVRSIPGMAITSAAKMKHVHRTSMSYDGQHVQTIRFDHRKADILRGNWRAAANLVDACAEVAATRADEGSHVLFRQVPFEAIRSFIVATDICNEHMDLKKPHLLGYLDEMGETFGPWNVAVMQPRSDTSSTRELGELGQVRTIRRSRLEASPDHYADIKALMSKRDILVDAEPERIAEFDGKEDWTNLKSLRPKVPLLLLYPIDGKSPPKGPTKTRVPLDAVEDVMGFGIVFPGQKDRSGGYFAVELDAPAADQFEEDELEEIGEPREPQDA
ncbi:endonuclease [Salipiger sp. IMCC34102]|uniref:Z1 domain-containing protein n=1 Tax=Salipiger sp. IMCC34102 TaxID=2510647 RepID=UPI00101E19C4|nr:Z1 domain-containing protein [Salipiger sp. IMCC34102]RYH01105.1 endonuclease [Salipiger sp. IMCC34102]